MRITSSTSRPIPLDADWIAIPLFDDDTAPPASVAGTPLGDLLGRLIAAKVVSGGLGDTTPILGAEGLGPVGILAVGLGKRTAIDAAVPFTAGVATGKKLGGKPKGKVAVVLPDGENASAIVEGIIVGTRGIDLRRSEPSRHKFDSLEVLAPGADTETLAKSLQRAEILGNAINLARDLTNTPPAEKSPTVLADWARREAEAAGIAVEVWNEARIAEERFGGLIAVAEGSDQPPRFVVLSYLKGGDTPKTALVGKGVTFDSGGLSLKPSASMEDMKSDMTGAAVVVATMTAIARLGLAVNVVGYLPITENMTGGRAMKLGDVLTMRNGKTVESQTVRVVAERISPLGVTRIVEPRSSRSGCRRSPAT